MKTTNKTQTSKPGKTSSGDMRAEYRFDYRKARPNRFASRIRETPLVVLLDTDIAQVFTTSGSVNQALRALITALPKNAKRKTAAG